MKSHSLSHFIVTYTTFYVLEELPHHITDVDTLVTLKETLSIALKKDKFRCNNYFRVLLQVTILLSGKSDNSVMDY